MQKLARPLMLAVAFLLATFVFGQGQDSIRAVNGVLTISIVPAQSFYKVFVDQAVTSTVFTNQVAGTIITVYFLQDSTGHTVVFGGNITAGCTVSSAASATTACQFLFDAANNKWTSLSGGGSSGTSPSGSSSVYVGPNCTGTANCFLANFDTQMAFTVTCNNTSATIATGANDPPFVAADVGKLIAGTSGGAVAAGCPPQGTIQTVTDAHHVVVSVAATQTTTAGVLAWGHNDGAAIQNAFAASLTRLSCLYLAEGGAFFDVPPFLDQRSASTVGTPPCVKGTGNTRLIPLPSFAYSNCAGNGGCVFQWSNANNTNPNYAELEDFEVISPSYNLTGSGASNSVFNLQRVMLKNVWLWNWGGSVGVGMAFSEPVAAYNPIVETSGSTACQINNGGPAQVTIDQGFCQGLNVTLAVANPLVTYGMEFGSPTNTSNAINVSSTWASYGDFMLPGTGASDTIRIGTGGSLSLNGATVQGAASNTLGAIDCNASGATVSFQNTKIDGGTSGIAIRSVAGCNVKNYGNNTFVQGTLSLSGNNFSVPSETQTGTCSTNAATVTFKLTYQVAPLVSVSDTTSASTGAQATATNTTTATIHCNGASDTFVATVYPNPI